jgi:putative ABC transport system substrate-binding protein
MKKIGYVFFAALFSAVGFASMAMAADKHVAITQIVEHPALDACRKGVKDALADAGFKAGGNLQWSYENAQGNGVTASQIAKKFVGMSPDVIVAIATPSAQTVAAATKSIPLVFSAVTDPVGAKLVSSWEKPGANVTGISDMSPIAAHLKMVREVMPGAKRLGVVSNPGEANSVSLVNMIKSEAPKLGMTVTVAAATKSGEVMQAARSLAGKVDAIYIPTDNTVVSAFESVVKVGKDAKIPVFAGDTDSVKRGAVAAMGFNYYDVGRETGAMVVKILNGEKPGNVPVSLVSKLELAVNPRSAKDMGITLSDDFVAKAKDVIK